MSFQMKVDGLHELNAALKAVGGPKAKKVLRDAVRKGAKLYRDDAKARVPSKYRTLRRSIVMRVKQRTSVSQDATITTARVGPTKGKTAKYDAWYAHMFEFGVDRHDIKPKGQKKVLWDNSQGALLEHPIPEADHPGIEALHFMTGAAESQRRKSINVLREDVRNSLRVIWAGQGLRAKKAKTRLRF